MTRQSLDHSISFVQLYSSSPLGLCELSHLMENSILRSNRPDSFMCYIKRSIKFRRSIFLYFLKTFSGQQACAIIFMCFGGIFTNLVDYHWCTPKGLPVYSASENVNNKNNLTKNIFRMRALSDLLIIAPAAEQAKWTKIFEIIAQAHCTKLN